MYKITISVQNSSLELLQRICEKCNCCIFGIKKESMLFSSVCVGSIKSINLYQLGFEFGAYSPVFIAN